MVGLASYRTLTTVAAPLIGLYLRRRLGQGKEDGERFGERLGHPGRPRPSGPLVWVHAASVGEATSALPLIERIMAELPSGHVLITTGTVTSARVMEERLSRGAFHQYVPADRPDAVRRFIEHWRPDLALWVESELWPNLITETAARLPLVLVNGRMSERSYQRWQRFPAIAAEVLAAFSLCLAQNEAEAERLRALGGRDVRCAGNLKEAAGPLPVDAADLARLRARVGDRPVWLAASTHAGEEAIAVNVHRSLRSAHPGLLTIIVPRHAIRGSMVADKLRSDDLRVANRSSDDDVDVDTDIYVADTMGELGLFYRLAPIAFVGGSLVQRGGQNPLEPARLDCAILYGQHMENFADATRALEAAGAAVRVGDADALRAAITGLLSAPALCAERARAARRIVDARDGVLDTVFAEVAPFLPRGKAEPAGART